MIKNLLKLADRLESDGNNKVLADRVDQMLVAFAQDIEGKISAKDLVKVQPGETRKHHMLRNLLDLVDFDLMIDRDEEGQGNRVKAVPKIQEGKTDALNLGEISSMPGLERFLKVEKQGPVWQEDQEGAPKPRDIDEALEGIGPTEEPEPLPKPEDTGPPVNLPPNQFKLTDEQKKLDRTLKQQVIPGATEEVERGSWLPPEEQTPEDLPFIPSNQFYVDNPANRRKHPDLAQGHTIEQLVKMADKFDQEGNYEMAEKVDAALRQMTTEKIVVDGTVGMSDQNPSQPLQVEAARPKAPLKGLKDDVKKNLVMFIMDADKSMSKGVGGLKELFRRLRYFDIADTVKDLGLDKVVKEMEKTQSCLDSAKKDFYTITFGKRPSEKDLEGLLKELAGDDSEDDDGQAALDFFGAHSENDVEYEVQEEDELEVEDEDVSVDDDEEGDDDIEDMLKEFWDNEEMQ